MVKSNHYPVVIETDEEGVFIVSCPMFKGCRSYGETIDEAMDNIREAIELCLDDESDESNNRYFGFRELDLTQHA